MTGMQAALALAGLGLMFIWLGRPASVYTMGFGGLEMDRHEGYVGTHNIVLTAIGLLSFLPLLFRLVILAVLS